MTEQSTQRPWLQDHYVGKSHSHRKERGIRTGITCCKVSQDEAKRIKSDTKGVQLHILPVQRIIVPLHHPFSVHSRQRRQKCAQHTKHVALCARAISDRVSRSFIIRTISISLGPRYFCCIVNRLFQLSKARDLRGCMLIEVRLRTVTGAENKEDPSHPVFSCRMTSKPPQSKLHCVCEKSITSPIT